MKKIILTTMIGLFVVINTMAQGGMTGTLTWVYNSVTKTLIISGTGAMPNYNASYNTPWALTYPPCYHSVKHIEISEGVTSIGNYAFGDCTALTSITIPNSVTSIGDAAFYKCKLFPSITISDKVTSIGGWAFGECKALTSVTIGNGIKSIGNAAFYNCSLLDSIIIPENVTSVGEQAFYGCSGLQHIYARRTSPPAAYSNSFEGVSVTSCKLHVPARSKQNYEIAMGWRDFFSIEEEAAQAPLILQIKSSETGSVNQYIENGSTPSFSFTATEGWKVNTIMYNNVDVTNQLTNGVYTLPAITGNGVLSVSFIETTHSNSRSLSTSNLKVYAMGSELVVANVPERESIAIYNSGGIEILRTQAQADKTVVSGLQKGQVYIVKTAGETIKVFL